MDLKTYLVERDGRTSRVGVECVRVAKRAGTTPNHLYMLALGYKRPSLDLATEIERATRGKVTVGDWSRRKESVSRRRA
jgi:hypothetical protein